MQFSLKHCIKIVIQARDISAPKCGPSHEPLTSIHITSIEMLYSQAAHAL